MSLQILIVDDNRELADNLAEILVDEGHLVATAYSGVEALALAEARSFDYVLTDYNMPGMTGVELIGRLHSGDSNATYLLMTAHASDALRATAAERELIAAILSKPLPIDRLLALILTPAGSRLLLVEDDVDLADVLAFSLESRGFSVRIAHSLSEARAAIAAETPDLAIVDVVLPDGDGVALLGELRSCEAVTVPRRSIPVVLMTGLRDFNADELRRLAPGTLQLLTKPFSPDALIKALALLGRG